MDAARSLTSASMRSLAFSGSSPPVSSHPRRPVAIALRDRAEVGDAVADVGPHVRFHVAGMDDVSGDAAARDLGSQMTRELVERRLAGAVGAVDRARFVQGGSRGDVDDAPPAVAHHCFNEGVAGEIGTDGVDHDRVDPGGGIGLPDQLDRPENAGSVDQDRRRSEPAFDLGLHGGDRLRRPHIRRDRDRRSAFPRDLLECGGELAGAARNQGNPHAAPGEPQRCQAPKSAPCPGDNSYPASQFVHPALHAEGPARHSGWKVVCPLWWRLSRMMR